MSDPTAQAIHPAAAELAPATSKPGQSLAPVENTGEPSASSAPAFQSSGLTPKQAEMLDQLADGMSIADTARIVGVSRNTIYRWLRDDPVVRAAYNKWKLACEESARARLVALQDTAVDVLADELENKRSARIAALLLDRMGLLTRSQSGSTDPRRAAAEIELDRREQSAALYERSESMHVKELFTNNPRIWPREALAVRKKE